ncbi:MAG TPA: hypothetical protein VFC00_02800 [Micromonosporaceae bacterium]|nr:hypothetical protein [Micromonosporaceae bacterium]
MPTPARAPIAQIRVIAAAYQAQVLIADIAACARALLGENASYRVHTRPARRVGHARAYLTITPVRKGGGPPQ